MKNLVDSFAKYTGLTSEMLGEDSIMLTKDQLTEAHDDIQGDLAGELADELMSIIGYDEDRPEIEVLIKDHILDFYNVEKR